MNGRDFPASFELKRLSNGNPGVFPPSHPRAVVCLRSRHNECVSLCKVVQRKMYTAKSGPCGRMPVYFVVMKGGAVVADPVYSRSTSWRRTRPRIPGVSGRGISPASLRSMFSLCRKVFVFPCLVVLRRLVGGSIFLVTGDAEVDFYAGEGCS